MEITSKGAETMTKQQMIEKAAQLETDANTLYLSLLAPSMTEKAMRDEARELRQAAEAQ